MVNLGDGGNSGKCGEFRTKLSSKHQAQSFGIDLYTGPCSSGLPCTPPQEALLLIFLAWFFAVSAFFTHPHTHRSVVYGWPELNHLSHLNQKMKVMNLPSPT